MGLLLHRLLLEAFVRDGVGNLPLRDSSINRSVGIVVRIPGGG